MCLASFQFQMQTQEIKMLHWHIVRQRACLEKLKIERIQNTELFMHIYIPCLFIAQWCRSIISVCNNSICFSNLCVQNRWVQLRTFKGTNLLKICLVSPRRSASLQRGGKKDEILGFCSVRTLHGSVLFLIRNSHVFLTVRGTRLQKPLSSVTALACKQLPVA